MKSVRSRKVKSSDVPYEKWLKEKIEKLYGKKCKDYEPGCPACDAWHFYETIMEYNRGKL